MVDWPRGDRGHLRAYCDARWIGRAACEAHVAQALLRASDSGAISGQRRWGEGLPRGGLSPEVEATLAVVVRSGCRGTAATQKGLAEGGLHRTMDLEGGSPGKRNEADEHQDRDRRREASQHQKLRDEG